MSEQNQPFDTLQEVKDIKRLMERSSRFSSLSGLSCVAAGIFALLGAWGAFLIISDYYGPDITVWHYTNQDFTQLKLKLLGLAAAVFALAGGVAFYFTWRKAKKQNVSLLAHSSRRVFWSMAIPLVTGGLFVLGMLQQDEWRFVSAGCLVFYGLALVNAGKYTVADIRYLGYCEIALGLANIFFTRYQFGYGLYYWALGFGVLHIVYGIIMWWKYDRKPVN